MANFSNLSIQNKFKIVILFTNAVILLLASLAFVINEWFSFRSHLVKDLFFLANLVGINSTPGLLFDDAETITRDLASLQVNSHIISAQIFSIDGKKVASYFRDNNRIDSTGTSEIKPVADHYAFQDDYVEVFKTIIFQKEPIFQPQFLGTVYLQSDLQEIKAFWDWLGYIVTIIFLVSLALAFLLASKLQQFITAPIYSLLETMNLVTTHKNFSVRCHKLNHDELGYLIDGFNQMLVQIESCNNEITQSNQSLSHTLQQLQQTQQQLIESEKMAALGNLVAGVAHEVNTPLGVAVTVASGLNMLTEKLAELFSGGKMKRSDLEDYFKHTKEGTTLVLKNLSRAAELVKSFKQVAVDQTGEQTRQFQLKPYLHEILCTLQPALKHTPHQVTLVCDEEITLTSYPGAFSQIITNLVMNSLVHGFSKTMAVSDPPQGFAGQMTITAKTENHKLMLRYSDNGKGIAKDILPHIFEPFFTTNRQGGGSGLGLHIVYNVVTHKLKGTIHCESIVEQGTTFIIEIPL